MFNFIVIDIPTNSLFLLNMNTHLLLKLYHFKFACFEFLQNILLYFFLPFNMSKDSKVVLLLQ